MKNTAWKSFAVYLVIFLLFFSMIEFFGGNNNTEEAKQVYGTNYTEFMENVEKGKIKEVTITTYDNYQEITGTTKDKEVFTMPISKNDDNLTQKLVDKGIKVTQAETPEPSPLFSLLSSLLPVLLLVGLFFFFMSQTQGGGGKMNQFGKSKARMTVDNGKRVTFQDVAGADEVKEELAEVVDFLKKPQKFKAIGAKIPKGVLLFGPPGTGKTLLARAVAGEAGVPFFTISGSDFVEMFVGVGASRVRDLFETAKKNAPSIIFIDEIDAVGRKRGNGVSGGHDEREQTLNQLLVEMDGFEGDEGVIVMAATNRSDVLDPALLRPGRFDRKVLVGRPDVKGREAILKVHAKDKPLAPDVDLKEVARQTPGFVGADLENVLNEAALVAARRNKTEITASDIDEAEDRVIAGPAKKDTVISPEERKRVAYHEAGHAIVGLVLSDSRTVRKVTIVPRGRAGGYNIMLPKEDENIITKKQLMEQVAGLMGGRAGEEVVVGDKSTGASNDFEQATNIARGMVTQYGMTDVGMTELESPSMQSPYGTKPYSEATAAKIDEAVKEILDEGHKQAVDIIKSHRETHKIIAEALLKYETLNEKQILSLFKTGKMPENDENEFPSESKASTYEEAKAAMEKKDQQREETENKDDKEDIHPLPDDHKNIDNIPLNPPSEKNESDDHSSDENKDD